MEKPKRRYRQSERAKAQAETRLRIVEATVALHEEVGPRATTISAIAEKAGVQRATVYRHFPDEAAVFQACTSHWLALNPPPDPSLWEELNDPLARVRAALEAFYGYYAGTHGMWAVSYRDTPEVPALQGPMEAYEAVLAAIAEDLTTAFAPAAGREEADLRATIAHALAFPTWDDLEARGLDEPAKVDLAEAWVGGVLAAARRTVG